MSKKIYNVKASVEVSETVEISHPLIQIVLTLIYVVAALFSFIQSLTVLIPMLFSFGVKKLDQLHKFIVKKANEPKKQKKKKKKKVIKVNKIKKPIKPKDKKPVVKKKATKKLTRPRTTKPSKPKEKLHDGYPRRHDQGTSADELADELSKS